MDIPLLRRVLESRWRPLWLFCISVLGFTAILKIQMVIFSFDRMNVADPVVAPLTVRTVVIVAILSELLTIGFLLMLRSDSLRAATVLWWSFLVLAYRHWFPTSKGAYCPCFGHLPEMLGLSSGLAALAARILIQSFLVGSLVVLACGPVGLYLRRLFRRKAIDGVRIILILPVLASTSFAELEKETWEISGLVSRTTLSTDNDALSTESGWFRALVGPSAMAMTVIVTNNPFNKKPRVLEYEYRTDSKHSVSFGRFDTNIVAPDDYIYAKKISGEWLLVTNKEPLKLDNAAHAILCPTPLPNEYTSHAIPLVLVFGWRFIAPLYGPKKGPTLLDYGQSLRGELQLLRYEAATNASSPFRGLSRLATFYETKETSDLFTATGRFPMERGDIPERLEYRNLLPLESMTKFKVSTNLGLEIVVVVTNAMVTSKTVPDMLAFADLTMANDRRFSLRRSDWIPAVMYTSTNNSLPTEERVMAQQFYQNAVVQWESSSRQNKKRRIFFIVFGVFPAIMLGWWVIKRTTKQTKQES